MTYKKISFTVTKHLPFGLRVVLEDGRKGVIRTREISWDAKERLNWQELHQIGKRGQAAILKEEPDEDVELSLRLIQKDPWENVSTRFRVGQLTTGVVTGVVSYGAFIQLDESITGLLHVSSLPDWINQNPLDVFWPGDHVNVRIDEINYKERRIRLSYSRIQSPLQDHTGNLPSSMPQSSETHSVSSRLDQFLKSGKQQKSILVIEDDPAQAKMVATWLQRIGQRVTVAENGLVGLRIIEEQLPDIALVDLRLPGENGIQIIRKISQNFPTIQCTLMTDWSHTDEFSQELEALASTGTGHLLKPLLPDDLLDLLLRTSPANIPTFAPTGPGPIQASLMQTAFNQQALDESLTGLLDQCRQQTRFEACFLFVLDPIQRSVEVASHSKGASFFHGALDSLQFSPVQDAAEDGEFILTEHLKDSDLPRFRYLHEFFSFSACLGMQIPLNQTKRYALFLMDQSPKGISHEVQIFFQGIAFTIGVLLDKFAFQEQAISLQRTALLGHLTRGLVHEINHQLGVLNAATYSLDVGLRNIAKTKEEAEITRRVESAQKQLQKLTSAVKSITSTTKQFGHILTRPKEELLRIDELVDNAIRLVSEISDRAKVKIFWEPPQELTVIRGQGTALEQVLVNLLLNAIQQLAAFGPDQTGWVKVKVEVHHKVNDHRNLCIIIQDNGPGIHLRLWERIFEAGFSTREDGSGMGLYISRSLMEAMGGSIGVSESYIIGGSSFLIELPYQI